MQCQTRPLKLSSSFNVPWVGGTHACSNRQWHFCAHTELFFCSIQLCIDKYILGETAICWYGKSAPSSIKIKNNPPIHPFYQGLSCNQGVRDAGLSLGEGGAAPWTFGYKETNNQPATLKTPTDNLEWPISVMVVTLECDSRSTGRELTQTQVFILMYFWMYVFLWCAGSNIFWRGLEFSKVDWHTFNSWSENINETVRERRGRERERTVMWSQCFLFNNWLASAK